jgi:nucleotide-binding universal stress UspA family protein
MVRKPRRAHADGVEGQRSRGRITVGVDGSQVSLQALHWAAAEAARRGAGVDVVHAWRWPHSLLLTEVFREPAQLEARAWELVHRAVESLAPKEDAPFDVRPVVVEDQAVTALLQTAETAQLLVVGSRGRGGFSGLLLGSVSQHCIRQASCPVAVIPPTWTGDRDGPVVVGVDGSDQSYGALHWAIDEAATRDVDLHVVNAYDYVQVAMPIGLVPGVDRKTMEDASRTLLKEMVEPALFAADHRPDNVALIPLPSGPARALLDASVDADLLVVGSRGRGGVQGILLGSVSQQCAHHTPCPIVVVRSSSDRGPQPDTDQNED